MFWLAVRLTRKQFGTTDIGVWHCRELNEAWRPPGSWGHGHLQPDTKPSVVELTDSARRVERRDSDAARGDRELRRIAPARTKSRPAKYCTRTPATEPDPTLLGFSGHGFEVRASRASGYVVLHDTTIDGIATSRPTTRTLRGIPGSAKEARALREIDRAVRQAAPKRDEGPLPQRAYIAQAYTDALQGRQRAWRHQMPTF